MKGRGRSTVDLDANSEEIDPVDFVNGAANLILAVARSNYN